MRPRNDYIRLHFLRFGMYSSNNFRESSEYLGSYTRFKNDALHLCEKTALGTEPKNRSVVNLRGLGISILD
ncbi:hypothetical protein TUMEXPCC7403_09030 [Tumidithrix helvetica PCC 7403]